MGEEINKTLATRHTYNSIRCDKDFLFFGNYRYNLFGQPTAEMNKDMFVCLIPVNYTYIKAFYTHSLDTDGL